MASVPKNSSLLETQNLHSKEPLGKCLFESLRRGNPNKIINVSAETGEILTRGKLLEDSIKATAVLRELGLERGDVVSIVAENTINYCVIVLAALYMGVTVNLLNPEYLTEELKHALLISKPKVVISSETTINILVALKNELKFVRDILLFNAKHGGAHKVKLFEHALNKVEVDTDSFAPETVDYCEHNVFILGSSGTTGLPKGVPVTSLNLEGTLNSLRDAKLIGMTSADSGLLVLPLFHVFGLMVQIGAIVNSAKIILMSKFKPDLFLESIEKHKVTKLFAVPTLLGFLTKSPLVLNYDITSLKFILVGGAPLSKDVHEGIKERIKNVDLRQCYGATETAGVCIFQMSNMADTISVGELITGIECMIWDHNLKERLGPRQTGELCFRGPSIIKGYLTDKPLTEDFIDEEGFWHSGDMGYHDEQGQFYVVDRIKELIKYKGFQVSPTELEALIISHPKVKECGVIGIPDKRCGQLPLAYVVIKDNTAVSKQEIVDYVAERISVQKHLHGGVIFINEIPKSASGKILRKQLLTMYNESLK